MTLSSCHCRRILKMQEPVFRERDRGRSKCTSEICMIDRIFYTITDVTMDFQSRLTINLIFDLSNRSKLLVQNFQDRRLMKISFLIKIKIIEFSQSFVFVIFGVLVKISFRSILNTHERKWFERKSYEDQISIFSLEECKIFNIDVFINEKN